MTVAGEFFADRDRNGAMGVDSADALWTWVRDPALRGLPKWGLEVGGNLFARGQSRVEYGLSSNLFRVCRASRDVVDESAMRSAESALTMVMREEGLGRLMTDGQLLMVLQHHGIPTRMIDVSAALAEALFFAVDQDQGSDGRLFMIHPHADRTGAVDRIRLDGDLPWGPDLQTKQARTAWTNRVALVDEEPLDPRMRAQRGRFLVGGLVQRASGQRIRVGGDDLSAAEFADVTTLSINFLRSRTRRPNSGWNATGWTIRVRSSWKAPLLERLRQLDPAISPDTMYPPLGEVRRLALRVAKDAVASA